MFGQYIQNVPRHLEPLTDRMRIDVALALHDRSAGLDLWLQRELQALPPARLRALASVLRLIEKETQWANACKLAPVALFPKGGDLSAQAMSWRPIARITALYPMWSSLRAPVAMRWQGAWIAPTFHARRRGQSVAAPLAELLLLALKQATSQGLLCGGHADVAKTFSTRQSGPWD